MAVRNPEDSSKEMDSYNVLVGVDSVDRGLSRINLVSLKLLTCVTYNFNYFILCTTCFQWFLCYCYHFSSLALEVTHKKARPVQSVLT